MAKKHQYTESCDYCGNDHDECMCHLAPDFPDEPISELDTDYLDWDHYEEENDEDSGQANPSEAQVD